MLISAASNDGSTQVYNAAPSLLGSLPSAKPTRTYGLQLSEPLDACASMRKQKHPARNAVLAVRGNCTFAAKAKHAQEAGAELLVVFDTDPGGLSPEFLEFCLDVPKDWHRFVAIRYETIQ